MLRGYPRSCPARRGALAAFALLVVAAEAGAQAIPRYSTVLWASCVGDTKGSSTDDGPISLHEVARRARPALWFSRDEPLLDLDGPLPREWPRRRAADATPEDLVYYRITKIKSSSSDDDLARAFRDQLPARLQAHVSPARADPEVIAEMPLDGTLLEQLKEFVIRYLFYYPNELGANGHVHDLESIELRVVVENADERGDPRAVDPTCRQIRVATLYGAAHGLGLYTNMLDLDIVLRDRLDETSLVLESTSRRTTVAAGTAALPMPSTSDEPLGAIERLTRSDPFWPLIVLVEEGKHASAPDRNGDGMFTPNFDVNRFSADAWGARDTMRSRQLSPVFRSDTFKRRVPEIVVSDAGTLRPAQLQDPWATQSFTRYLRYDYRLRRPTQDREVCGEPLQNRRLRAAAMRRYAAELTDQVGQGHPDRLLSGKAFCEDVAVHGHVNVTDMLGRVGFGGAYNGFTRWWERVSFATRFDGGKGWVATVPFGLQVPGLGGWVVARVSRPWSGATSRKSLDVAYMPSASRFADWYAAAGLDHGVYAADGLHEDGRRLAVEAGVKFRFPLPDLGTFLGGRIGVRANGRSSLQQQRLVFEVGAGVW